MALDSDGAGDTIALPCVMASITSAQFPKLVRIELEGGIGSDTDVINGAQLADTVTADDLDAPTSRATALARQARSA